MRRIAALLLIATSGWLLYQTMGHFVGLSPSALYENFARELGNPGFLLPALGGTLGLAGGLIAFFGGPGGAAIAMIGGVAIAGFAFTLNQSFDVMRIWENEAAVGIAILVLAAFTALLGRN
jgi:hypothetical protein